MKGQSEKSQMIINMKTVSIKISCSYLPVNNSVLSSVATDGLVIKLLSRLFNKKIITKSTACVINRLGIWKTDHLCSWYLMQKDHIWELKAITLQHKTLPLLPRENSLIWVTIAPCLHIVIAVTEIGRPLLVIWLHGLRKIILNFWFQNQWIYWQCLRLINVRFTIASEHQLKQPGHQYPQCWLYIRCIGQVTF